MLVAAVKRNSADEGIQAAITPTLLKLATTSEHVAEIARDVSLRAPAHALPLGVEMRLCRGYMHDRARVRCVPRNICLFVLFGSVLPLLYMRSVASERGRAA